MYGEKKRRKRTRGEEKVRKRGEENSREGEKGKAYRKNRKR